MADTSKKLGLGGLVAFLVPNFNVLADARPDFNVGIYQYAKEGFGNYVGFNIAWGYWLCAAMGNVAFAVMLNDSFSEFFPVLLHHGWQTVVFGSFFIWVMYFLVARGVKAAVALNTIVTVVKFAALILIVIILFIFFKIGALNLDFWGTCLTWTPQEHTVFSHAERWLALFIVACPVIAVVLLARGQQASGN